MWFFLRRSLYYIVAFSVVLAVSLPYSREVSGTLQPVIMIDPGHGGTDHGSIGGTTGVREDILNLAISFYLRDALSESGFTVYLTRDSENIELDASLPGNTLKRKDMQRRKRLVLEYSAEYLISIHMNQYPSTVPSGSQVFYNRKNAESVLLAQYIQAALHKEDGSDGHRTPAPGDFFMLNIPSCTGVLVECGFMSNPQEEQKLQDTAYQKRIADAIRQGIRAFWENKVRTQMGCGYL